MMLYIRYAPGSNIGNWLFQYLHAKKLSNNVAFYCTDDIGKVKLAKFKRLYEDAEVVDKLPSPCPIVYQFSEEEERTRGFPNGNYLLDGYFQDITQFDEDFASCALAIPNDVKSYILTKYPFFLSSCNLVGISVRRGDYMKIPHLLPFVGENYFRDAIALFPNAHFVVCSDDIPWCEKFFPKISKSKFTFIKNEPVLTQLYAQTLCNDNIISNSTFSWWGAYLRYLRTKNDAKTHRTIFPSLWFGISYKNLTQKPLLFPTAEILKNHYTIPRYLFALYMAAYRNLRIFTGRLLRKLHLMH